MDRGNLKEILSVSALNDRIKALLEEGFALVWVEGEVSNLRRPASGHVYFTLKDAKSQIRAVIFRMPFGRAGSRTSGFELEDGMSIVCRARLTVYPPRGEYQIIIDAVEPKGLGALQKAFEQLKARLEAEGLFDQSRKKPLPFLPSRIGVVTSPTGAVIRDILTVTRRRFPSVNILIAPVRVQGDRSAGGDHPGPGRSPGRPGCRCDHSGAGRRFTGRPRPFQRRRCRPGDCPLADPRHLGYRP